VDDQGKSLPPDITRIYEFRDHGGSPFLPRFRALRTEVSSGDGDPADDAMSEALANLLTHLGGPPADQELTIELHLAPSGAKQGVPVRALANGIADGSGAAERLWTSACEVLVSCAAGEASLPTLTFEHNLTLEPAAAQQLLPRFLASLGLPGCTWNAPNPVTVCVCLSVPGEAMDAWLRLPVKPAGRIRGFERISAPVQECLRAWVPLLYLATTSRLGRPSRALEALGYSVTRPSRSQTGRPARDILEPNSIHRALFRVEKAISQAVVATRQRLEREGQETFARRYVGIDPKRAIRRLLRLPRFFRALFATESSLLEVAAAFAQAAKRYRTEPTRPAKRRAKGDLQRLAKRASKRLRHALPGACLEPLAPLVLLEATLGANLLLGRRTGAQLHIRLQEHASPYAWAATLPR
jgi:hypothetical protein